MYVWAQGAVEERSLQTCLYRRRLDSALARLLRLALCVLGLGTFNVSWRACPARARPIAGRLPPGKVTTLHYAHLYSSPFLPSLTTADAKLLACWAARSTRNDGCWKLRKPTRAGGQRAWRQVRHLSAASGCAAVQEWQHCWQPAKRPCRAAHGICGMLRVCLLEPSATGWFCIPVCPRHSIQLVPRKAGLHAVPLQTERCTCGLPRSRCAQSQPFPAPLPPSRTPAGTSVELDAESQVEVGGMMEERGQIPVGWYHSHPVFEPRPSQKGAPGGAPRGSAARVGTGTGRSRAAGANMGSEASLRLPLADKDLQAPPPPPLPLTTHTCTLACRQREPAKLPGALPRCRHRAGALGGRNRGSV